MSTIENKRLDTLMRHIRNVQDNCNLLGERLAERGEFDLGKQLIANGLIHDNSKFYGIEWMYLHGDIMESEPELFKAAALQHVTTNLHHPEAWGGIEYMPRIFVAELVADWTARGSEFGTDIREYTKEKAAKKYNFTFQSKVYKEIKEFTDLLLDRVFK